jgi:hypothetical protein
MYYQDNTIIIEHGKKYQKKRQIREPEEFHRHHQLDGEAC